MTGDKDFSEATRGRRHRALTGSEGVGNGEGAVGSGEGGTRRKRPGSFGTGAAAVAAMAIVVAGIGYGILHNTLSGGAAGRVVPGSSGTATSGFNTAHGSTSLPNDLSSIVITKYTTVGSKRTDVSTYTLTGTHMDALYQAIQQTMTPGRKVPKNASISCPTYTSTSQYTARVWKYEITVRYPDHSSRSFEQTYAGCLFVQDEQSGATYMPLLKTQYNNLPGLIPLTWVKNK